MLSRSILLYVFFFFKQKTAYEMRISDWSSDVCSSDLIVGNPAADQASIPPFNTKVGRVVFASKRSRADAVRIPERHMKITSVEGSIVSRLVSHCESGWECAPAIWLRTNSSASRISTRMAACESTRWRASMGDNTIKQIGRAHV